MVHALLLAGVAACSSDETTTAIHLTVTFDAGLTIDQLRIFAAPGGEAADEPRLVPKEPQPLSSGEEALLLVPGDWGGRTVTVRVVGLKQGADLGSGENECVVQRGKQTDLLITLASACEDECPAGDSQCVGDAVRTCRVGLDGCARWSPPEDCPPDKPFCSKGRCAEDCEDECSKSGERRCTTGGYQVCGEHDSDTCLDWGPVLGCGDKELCRDGECLPDCNGQLCACQEGESTTCADLGECTGGVRVCKDGVFGSCERTVGPTAEICDGKDNDCDTEEDNNLVAPACKKQKGVCAGAVQRCGGASGWQVCDAAAYAARAASQGLTYEADETLCDGQDNDCDGEIDELAGCCQPDCGGRVCGPDPKCGRSCGPCPAGQSCTAQGQCQSSSCTPVGPLVVDSQGDVGEHTSLALDSAGKVHISYYDSTNDALKVATNTSGTWVTSTAIRYPDTPSSTVDGAGKAHICYFDYTDDDNNTNDDLKYATNASGAWLTSTVDYQSYACLGISLTLDGTGRAHVSYFAGPTLMYATNTSGTWIPHAVKIFFNPLDWALVLSADSSVALDSTKKSYIGYSYTKLDAVTQDLKSVLKVATNASGTWVTSTIDSQAGMSPSVAVDNADKAHVSYYDGRLRYATNTSGTWVPHTIDSQGDVGYDTSLAVDSAGKAHIGYYDATNQDLKYATNASGVWVTSTVDSQGDVGEHTSLAVDSDGRVHISYYDATNQDLKYVAICP